VAQQKKRAKKATEKGDYSGDLPQEITESYGTGVIEQPGLNEEDITTLNDSSSEYGSSSQISGGDGDAVTEPESATGEELVGGSAPTPDQDMVDELGAAAGIEMADGAILHTADMLDL
jgi:Family of unknown function (DUF6335)